MPGGTRAASRVSSSEELMRTALHEATAAIPGGDVPVGAVVVDAAGVVLAAEHNRREADQDPTAHAELLALRAAAASLGGWRLDGCTLVVTLEPCTMCAGAAVLARVARIVYGAEDPKAGAVAPCGTSCATGGSTIVPRSSPAYWRTSAVRCSASGSS